MPRNLPSLILIFSLLVQISGDNYSHAWTGKPSHFTVHALKPDLHSQKELQISVCPCQPSASKPPVPLATKVNDNKDGTYSVEYVPLLAVDHLVTVQYQGVNITSSPFRVTVSKSPDASKCKLSMAGAKGSAASLSSPLKSLTGDPVHLLVDAHEAGVGKLRAEARHKESGETVDAKVTLEDDDNDNVFGVILSRLVRPGSYEAALRWGTENIPQSPLTVVVSEKLTADMITVSEFLIVQEVLV